MLSHKTQMMSVNESINQPFRVLPIPAKKENQQRKISHFFGKSNVGKLPAITKKVRQSNIKSFFHVTKATNMSNTRLNFQGYPLSQCVYSKEIQDMVYWPIRFCGPISQVPQPKTCKQCLLTPCIVSLFGSKIVDFAGNQRYGEGRDDFTEDDIDDMYCETMDFVCGLLVQVFGRKYVQSHGPPECAHTFVGDFFNLVDEENDKDNDKE